MSTTTTTTTRDRGYRYGPMEWAQQLQCALRGFAALAWHAADELPSADGGWDGNTVLPLSEGHLVLSTGRRKEVISYSTSVGN